jgi:hypothetical protein
LFVAGLRDAQTLILERLQMMFSKGLVQLKMARDLFVPLFALYAMRDSEEGAVAVVTNLLVLLGSPCK